jgi:glycerol-1-phosphate dehydrogenase [NAD(P)+]
MAKQIDYHVSYGIGISNELVNNCMGKKVLLVTDNLLWSKYGRIFKKLNPILVMTKTMEAIVLEEENKNLPDFDVTIGLGGGMALDIAKFHAWKSQKTLFQVPTAISMDAMFSYPIALRYEGKVKYVGEIIPENIYCDFGILNSAPPIMNRSGICDLLSCHTALYDWKLAVNKGLGKMDNALFDKTVGILNQVKDNVSEIYDVTEKGIRMMMEGYKFVAVENYRVGHCQYEEGSEHFFYYCLEALTNKHFLHGKVINLGILLMSMLQNNHVDEIIEIIKKSGVPIHPASMEINYDDIRNTLRQLNGYVVEKGYSHSILNEKYITEEFISSALQVLKREFDPEY